MEETIKYKQLSKPIKIAITTSWILLTIYTTILILGIISTITT